MKNVTINAVIRHEVLIDPAEAFEKIKNALGFKEDRDDGIICEKDQQLMRRQDVSYHGSPVYDYEVMSNNPKWIELYNSVKCIADYFKHQGEPQWDKMIKPEKQSEG